MGIFQPLIEKAYAGNAIAITPSGTLTAVGNAGSATDIANNVYVHVFDFLTLIAGILAVLYIIWMGIQYITAGGSADKTKAARSGIINAVIGIIIIVAAYAIVRFAIGLGNTASTLGQ